MSFQEVFVEDECIKLPTPFKRDREWFRDFEILNQNKSKSFQEDCKDFKKKISEDDKGSYLMRRNIGHLFTYICDLACNKDIKLFELWNKKEFVTKKRIEVINNCLDVYDIIFPYNMRKPILSKYDLKPIHNLMDRLFYDTAYPIMDQNGVDLNMELGSPGWLDLKKVLLRFFSKIKFDREFYLFEEEVEGTGFIRPLYRDDGSKLNGTGTFLLSIKDKEDKEVKLDLESKRNN